MAAELAYPSSADLIVQHGAEARSPRRVAHLARRDGCQFTSPRSGGAAYQPVPRLRRIIFPLRLRACCRRSYSVSINEIHRARLSTLQNAVDAGRTVFVHPGYTEPQMSNARPCHWLFTSLPAVGTAALWNVYVDVCFIIIYSRGESWVGRPDVPTSCNYMWVGRTVELVRAPRYGHPVNLRDRAGLRTSPRASGSSDICAGSSTCRGTRTFHHTDRCRSLPMSCDAINCPQRASPGAGAHR